jgi:phosphate transport system substrate-binding protein
MDQLKRPIFGLLAALLALTACEQGPRQQIKIVGSSTVYPFTNAVAERFAQNRPSFHAPIVESTGTGAGMQLFCAGVGTRFPDVVNASRRIKANEFQRCHQNGVNHIVEVPVGIDGLALIESAQRPTGFNLSVRDVYAALAAEPFGRPQTARTWREVNPALPDVPILVYGPPPSSGTRDSLVELILIKGCESDPAMEALKARDPRRQTRICTHLREDGRFVEAGENDNLLIQRVSQNQGTIGVLGYSFMEENLDRVRGVPIGGVVPTAGTIRDFTYPGARMLYVYVKGEHLDSVPGLREFLAEYERGWGPGSYLADRGLIPLPDNLRAQAAAIIAAMPAMSAAGLH